MNTTTLKKIKVTNHAFERYCQRVTQIPESKADEERMKAWFGDAVTKGTKLPEPGENGATLYLYRGHKIVYNIKQNTVISVHPYKPQVDEESGYHDVREEMGALVSKKLSKQLKVLTKQYRELMIAVHKEEIKRLSVFNPETQDIIARRVFKMQEEVSLVENKIESIRLVATQYGVEV